MTNEIVADLSCNHNFVPPIRERLGDQLFAQAVSVRIGCIKQCHTDIERPVHEFNRFALSKISPPAGRNRPQPEADFAYCQVGIFVSAKLHGAQKIKRSSKATPIISSR